MATGDFADLYGLTAKAARRDTSLSADLVDCKSAVNETYMRVCESGDNWDFLQAQGSQAMVAGTETYSYSTIGTSLSVTVSDVIGVGQGFTSAPEMEYVGWEDYWAIKALNPSLGNGVPAIWTKTSDGNVHIWPKPNATTSLTILALKAPTELTSDAHEPFIPLQMRRRIIVPGAAAILLRQEGGEEAEALAARMEDEYLKALDELRKSHAIERTQKAPVRLPASLEGTSGTYLELAQRACYSAGLKPWLSWDLTRAKEAVNAAYLSSVTGGEQWDFLEFEGQWTTTAGSDVYLYSTIATAIGITSGGIAEVLMLVNDTDGGRPLDSMSWQSLERLAASTQDGDARGTPVAWAKWGTRLRLGPTPDAAYAIGAFVRMFPGAMSSDSDAPLIPAVWRHRIIVPKAAAELAREVGDQKRADILLAEYKDAFRDFREAHGAAKSPTLSLYSPTFGEDLPGYGRLGWW